jgi:hypothetical protein
MFVLASLRYSRSRQTLAAPPSRHIKGANDKQLASGNSEEGNDEEQVMSELKLSKSVPTFRANGSPQLKVERELQKKIPLDFQRNKMALERERQELQAEKNVWAREKQKIMTTNTFDKIVTLNVGGTKYTTSLSTLTKYPDSMLGAMFSGRHALPQQEDGSFFIDRDGDTFRYVLLYLRDDRLARALVPQLESTLRLHLQFDAEYFQLRELETVVRLCQGSASPQRYSPNQRVGSRGLQDAFRPVEAVMYQLEYKDKEIVLRNTAKSIHQELTVHHNLRCENVVFLNNVSFKQCDMSGSVFRNCCFQGTVSFEGSILSDVTFENVGGLHAHFAPWQVSQGRFEIELIKYLQNKGLIY